MRGMARHCGNAGLIRGEAEFKHVLFYRTSKEQIPEGSLAPVRLCDAAKAHPVGDFRRQTGRPY